MHDLYICRIIKYKSLAGSESVLLTSFFNGAGLQQVLLEVLYRVPAVVIALSFHEWAHAYAAWKLGDPTARNLGRMTLNPFAHIDPIGCILMLLVRFGWAKPVPINIRNFKKPRRDDIIVSLAGVGVNFVLAFLSLGVLGLLIHFYVLNEIVLNIMLNFCFINLGLMVFNLIPIPPLDGSKIMAVLLPDRAYEMLMRYERFGILLLLALSWFGVGDGFVSRAIYGVFGWMVELFY